MLRSVRRCALRQLGPVFVLFALIFLVTYTLPDSAASALKITGLYKVASSYAEADLGPHSGLNVKLAVDSDRVVSTSLTPAAPATLLADTSLYSEEEAGKIPHCSRVSPSIVRRLQRERAIAVHTYHQGAAVAAADTLTAPAHICIIVVVPQLAPANGVYWNSPIWGKWPDTIHLYINSSAIRFSIPPLRALPAQPDANKLFAGDDRAILYYAEVALRDNGTYHLWAEQEAQNWSWAFHGWTEASEDVILANPSELLRLHGPNSSNQLPSNNIERISLQTMTPFEIPSTQFFPPHVQVLAPSGSQLQRLQQPSPLCHQLSSFDIGGGSWYDGDKFVEIPRETLDEFNYAYKPEVCQLDYFNTADIVNCLSNKVIHVLGDSNARRISRVLLSGGRWCYNLSDPCQYSDIRAPAFKVTLGEAGRIIEEVESEQHKDQFTTLDQKPFVFGANAKLWFSFITGIVYSPESWLSRFYEEIDFDVLKTDEDAGEEDSHDYDQPFDPSYISPDARARPLAGTEDADLVVVSMSSWDEGFDREYDAFEMSLTKFRDAIFEAYSSPKTKFILRLGQGYCCRGNKLPFLKLFSGTRMQHFGDIARKVFGVGSDGLAMHGKMKVLDASALTGRPEVVHVYPDHQHATNHQRAAHVRTEAQVLLNNVCTRDALSPKAIWKVE